MRRGFSVRHTYASPFNPTRIVLPIPLKEGTKGLGVLIGKAEPNACLTARQVTSTASEEVNWA